MKKKTPQILFWVFQMVLAAALLWWIFSRPGVLRDFTQALTDLPAQQIFATLAFSGLSLLCHVWRWWLCLKIMGTPVSYGRALTAFLASSLVGGWLIGGFGGDVGRVLLIAQAHPGASGKITASVVADRLCGLVSLLIPVLLFTLPMQDRLSHTVTGMAAGKFLVGYLVGAVLLFTFVLTSGTEFSQNRLPGWMPGRAWLLETAAAFHRLLKSPRALLAAVAVSSLMLGLHFAAFWAVSSTKVSFAEFSGFLPIVEAATTVPITPAGLGVREELFNDQLSALAQVPAGTASSISLLGFAGAQLWTVLGGILSAVMLFSSKKSDV